MLFSANSNRKISASLFDEMFDLELDNTLTPSNDQELLKELEQLKFETSNKTIEALIEELHKNNKKFLVCMAQIIPIIVSPPTNKHRTTITFN